MFSSFFILLNRMISSSIHSVTKFHLYGFINIDIWHPYIAVSVSYFVIHSSIGRHRGGTVSSNLINKIVQVLFLPSDFTSFGYTGGVQLLGCLRSLYLVFFCFIFSTLNFFFFLHLSQIFFTMYRASCDFGIKLSSVIVIVFPGSQRFTLILSRSLLQLTGLVTIFFKIYNSTHILYLLWWFIFLQRVYYYVKFHWFELLLTISLCKIS